MSSRQYTFYLTVRRKAEDLRNIGLGVGAITMSNYTGQLAYKHVGGILPSNWRDLAIQHVPGLLVVLGVLTVATAVASRLLISTGRKPPQLNDPVPYVFNTLQFLLDNEKFMERVRSAKFTTK